MKTALVFGSSGLIGGHLLYQLIKNEKEIEDWMKQSEEKGEFAIDTETTSLDPHTANLVGISISNRIGNACYIPLNHVSGNNLNEKKVLSILKNYLEDESIKKIGQNFKHDRRKYLDDIAYLNNLTPK